MEWQTTRKKAGLILLVLMPTAVAFGNPIVVPSEAEIARAIWIGGFTLLSIEIGITCVLLSIFGMAPMPTFFALVAVNIATFLGIMVPLAGEVHIALRELAVFIVETTFIIWLGRFALFREDPSVGCHWRFALLAVLVGNTTSLVLSIMPVLY